MVRKFLTNVATGKAEAPELTTNGIITKKKFLDLFKLPIAVLSVSSGRGSGDQVNFVFKDHPQYQFYAWVPADNGQSYIFEIDMNVDPEEGSAKINRHLHQKEYLPFWL